MEYLLRSFIFSRNLGPFSFQKVVRICAALLRSSSFQKTIRTRAVFLRSFIFSKILGPFSFQNAVRICALLSSLVVWSLLGFHRCLFFSPIGLLATTEMLFPANRIPANELTCPWWPHTRRTESFPLYSWKMFVKRPMSSPPRSPHSPRSPRSPRIPVAFNL